MPTLGSTERPVRVAIVGSGPSGFYAADPLLKSKVVCTVDMYDRLPTPFGLVRGGVAPDHAKIRKVTKVYEKIATHECFSFLGNVKIGTDLLVDELRTHYDAVIFACGAESDRQLGIPGQDLTGSHTATSFVGWYNAHPDYRDYTFDLSQEVAVVIGVGNVAMDVARVLAKTVDELKNTDIAEHTLDALAQSKIKEVHVIGRRGSAQAAFTPPEIKEMGELEDCDVIVDPAQIALNTVSEQELSDRNVTRNYEFLKKYAEQAPTGKSRRMHFRFLESPKEIKGASRVESVTLERNALQGDEPFKQKARGTGETTELPCGLLFASIGYHGNPIKGVPFHDAWGNFPHEDGRITDNGKLIPGWYAVGWIKRGPSGIIGTNKPDSLESVNGLLEDVPTLAHCEVPSTEPILKILNERNVRVVDLDGWHKIEAAEIARGEAIEKPRERFTAIAEMLSVLDR